MAAAASSRGRTRGGRCCGRDSAESPLEISATFRYGLQSANLEGMDDTPASHSVSMVRDDLSTRLIHFTRGGTDQEAASKFLSIFNDKKLLGSNQDIRGGYRCVCFTEAPVSKFAQVLAVPGQLGMRYRPFGVMVDKSWLFDHGGRPAIYQPESEFELLHESQRFRHMRYQPGKTDYTWEREWRIRADEIELPPEKITLVVPTRDWADWAKDRHAARVATSAMVLQGLIGSCAKFPWHFLVLEDLGVEIPGGVAPPAIS